MTKTKLFHSYLYISNSKNIYLKNSKIYDNNNEFICGLLNIPKNSLYSKIILEKNLIKNKQSKKNSNTFFEKNNIKVFVEINFKFINTINHSDNITIFKLLKSNYIKYIDANENLFKVICLNKNLKKEILNNDNRILEINNENILKIYNYYCDIINKKITKEIPKNIMNKINANGSIIYTDYIKETIKEVTKTILKNKTKNILVIYDNCNKDYWLNNISNNSNNSYKFYDNLTSSIDYKQKLIFVNSTNFSNIKKFRNWDIIIYDNTKINESYYVSCNKKIYISFNESFTENERIHDFLDKFNFIFDQKIDYRKITQEKIYCLSKSIIYHNFYDIYCRNGIINKFQLYNTFNQRNKDSQKFIYNLRYILNNNDDNSFKQPCSICYEVNEFLVKTQCNHIYCKNCLNQLINLKYDCSICRQKIQYFKKEIKSINCLFNKNNWYYIGENIEKIISQLISKINFHHTIIYLEERNIYNYISSIINIVNPKNKFNIILLDKGILDNFKNISYETNIKLFYLKTNKKMINPSKNIVMSLKKFFKNICLYELNML